MSKQHSVKTKLASYWHNPFTEWQKLDLISEIEKNDYGYVQPEFRFSVRSLSIERRQYYLNQFHAICNKDSDYYMSYPEPPHFKTTKLSKRLEQRKKENFAAGKILTTMDLYMHSVSLVTFIMRNFEDVEMSLHIADFCQTQGRKWGRTNEQMLYNFSCYKIMGHCKAIKKNFSEIPLFCGVISPKLLVKRSKILKKDNKKRVVLVTNLLQNYYQISRRYRYQDYSDQSKYLSELLLAKDLFKLFGEANHEIFVSEGEIDEAIRKSSFMVDQQQPSKKPKKRKKKSKKSKKSKKAIEKNEQILDNPTQMKTPSVYELLAKDDGIDEIRNTGGHDERVNLSKKIINFVGVIKVTA